MYPSYKLLPNLSSQKYKIYQYHETNPSYPPDPPGPSRAILFLPGSAGSYGQVRSIASETTRIYQNNKDISKFTFYTMHSNEEHSALHVGCIIDQAEYANSVIAWLLHETGSESLIVIAHSMVCIVRR
jgi:glycosylphosphatidylinositol deacylase